ncbi:hypothetical protein M405DRAFT_866894 [Rhizopogon salebrosus TDB-379]|nr:hypothetical protein M405DRAFT_866894 [Rhizopogon salebrosus TDB-379]
MHLCITAYSSPLKFAFCISGASYILILHPTYISSSLILLAFTLFAKHPANVLLPLHSYPTSNHFPPLTGWGVLYGLDNALSFLLIQFLLLGEAPSDVSAPGAFLLGEIVNPPHPPPLDTQILSTTMSKCLVCAPASSPIYLLALSTPLHPRTPHFIAYALRHTKLHSSITTLAALVLYPSATPPLAPSPSLLPHLVSPHSYPSSKPYVAV